jgi:acetyl esterase/lipase
MFYTNMTMKKTLGERTLIIPNRIFPGHNRRDNIAYGDHPLMRYDEFPSQNPNAPLVLFWYGGSWKTGNRGMYRFVGHMLQKMGAHAFVIDYPKTPERAFPGFIEDGTAMLEHVRKKYPDREIILMGHSAGGHTALLTGMQAEHTVSKIVSIAGVCTLSQRFWYPVFGEALRNGKSDPRHYAKTTPQDTKFFLAHGAIDTIVVVNDSITLHRKLEEAGKDSQLNIIPIADHIGILPMIAFGPFLRTKTKLKNFIHS